MTVTIIGLGLIGGSLALALKDNGIANKIIGVENNITHAARALSLGLADEIKTLHEAVSESDLVIICIPVDASEEMLPSILNLVAKQVIMDAGSTKAGILNVIRNHPKKGRFVATHPMWGTEFSGPDAAEHNAFKNKAVIICNKTESDQDALTIVEKIYRDLNMHIMYMTAEDHDMHVAYISHISHITSFALANTVLEKEREERAIFELASSGFSSTVRLAKSNAEMWVPIFLQNKENVLDVLNEHISQLKKFKSCLEKEDKAYLKELIDKANGIKRILDPEELTPAHSSRNELGKFQ